MDMMGAEEACEVPEGVDADVWAEIQDVRNRKDHDQCVLVHSNRMCVITIADSHPIINCKKTVTKVDFTVGKNNRLDNKVTGKGKKGAQILNKDAALCHVTCEDQSEYLLCSCINAVLIEANENLVGKPQLLTEKPKSDGYIAIVLPKLKDFTNQLEKLLTQDQYNSVLKQRQESQESGTA